VSITAHRNTTAPETVNRAHQAVSLAKRLDFELLEKEIIVKIKDNGARDVILEKFLNNILFEV
jgi:hypothetical protein